MDEKGFTLRSGGADGSDLLFENNHKGKKEIYIPWKGFNNSNSNLFIQPPGASEIAFTVHPIYENLKDSVKKLHDRNVLQVLGQDLKTPSDFVVCYTSDGCEKHKERTSKTGGTGTAISVASNRGIKVINVKNDESYEKLLETLEGRREKPKKPDPDRIKAREAKFIMHLPEIPDFRPDVHIVKEVLHMEDGRLVPNLRVIEHFKRPFWVTKEPYRKHKQKKESEELNKVNKYYATQSRLAKEIGARLGNGYIGVKTMRDVANSPYLYGCDVDSRTFLKKKYLDTYPDAVSSYHVATLDIETDTIDGDIAIISLSTREKIYTAINKKYLDGQKNVEKQLRYMFDKYIPKTDITKNIEIEYDILDNEMQLIKGTLKRAHEWKPDFIAIWNIDYDIPYMLKVCKKYGVDPKDIFSDPTLPKNLRYFEYKEGQKKRVTESGVFKPVNPEEQWHVVRCPATFYWIDAMSAHRYIRVGGKSMPGGYSLDNILKAELGDKFQKLKFESDETENIQGIEWHQYMLKNKPLEYTIYNQWDNISMLQLDEHTKDLSNTLPLLSGVSSFDIFNSGPKRIIDAMHFFYLEQGMVLGTKPPMIDDDKILGLGDWIVLLPSSRIKENGMKCVAENPNLITNVRAHVADADQVSGYPSNTQAANVSKDTTSREVINIKGVDKDVFKQQNINILFGQVNTLEYANTLFSFPTLEELDTLIKKHS